MSKISIVSVTVGLTFALASAQADGPPGLEKKGGVPPGLAKKGGVPPGLAKKQTNEPQQNPAPPAQVAAVPTPATPAATPAPATPVTPTAPTTTRPAPSAPVPQPPPTATPSTPSKPAVSNYELKNRLDKEVETIKDRIGENDLQSPALREISRMTGVPVGRLEEQRKAHGAGYPALLLGNLIAKQSNATFPQLMAARKTEKDWSTIAVRYHVPLQPLLDDLLDLKRHLNQVQQRRS